MVLYGFEFEFRNHVDVPIQSVVFLVKFERNCVVMLAGGGIFVGCCGVIDSPPAWFVLKIKKYAWGRPFVREAYRYGRLGGY